MSRRILFLAYGLDAVSCRFRIFQYLPYLRRNGLEADVADLHASARQRWRILRSAPRYDVVVIHRAFLNPLEHRWLRAVGRGYVYDFDDAVMFRDSSHARFESRTRRRRFRRMVAGARAVIAGNRYLADHAARYNQRVTVIPTAVDLSEYPACDPAPSRGPVVGWIGTRINLMYVRAMVPALQRLARRRPDVKLKIVSDGGLDIRGIQVINRPWSLADEVKELLSFRVGVMPLPDDPWTRGKCALKILQCFAAFVPVVCSPVGTNLDIVEHGRNGYWARNADEWVAGLEDLLADEEKCRRFAAVARETVQRTYSLEATAFQLLQTLQS